VIQLLPVLCRVRAKSRWCFVQFTGHPDHAVATSGARRVMMVVVIVIALVVIVVIGV